MLKFFSDSQCRCYCFNCRLCYVRLGFANPRADLSVGWLETKIAMPALDAAVDRRAPEIQNPLQPTEPNLIAGMKMNMLRPVGGL